MIGKVGKRRSKLIDSSSFNPFHSQPQKIRSPNLLKRKCISEVANDDWTSSQAFTFMPWAPQLSHSASVRWRFFRFDLDDAQTFSTQEARTTGELKEDCGCTPMVKSSVYSNVTRLALCQYTWPQYVYRGENHLNQNRYRKARHDLVYVRMRYERFKVTITTPRKQWKHKRKHSALWPTFLDLPCEAFSFCSIRSQPPTLVINASTPSSPSRSPDSWKETNNRIRKAPREHWNR